MKIIDNFLICLNESYDNYELLVALLQQYSKEANAKIHIINYSNLNAYNTFKECYEKWNHNRFEFGKSEVVVVESQVISMDWIESYVENLSLDDYVFIVGSERLLPYINNHKVVETKISELTYNSSYLYNEDWLSFTKWIDLIYGKYQSKLKGIVCTIYADAPSRKLINKYLQESPNLSIVGLSKVDFKQRSLDFDYELFYGELANGNYDFLVNYLESKKDKLERSDYVDLLKDAYLNFGFIEDTIELLSNESNLRLENKKLLIDLMIPYHNKRNQCMILAKEIYESNRFAKDLMPTILRLYKKSDEFEGWLQKSLQIDPNNPKVIENYANWLSDNNRFMEASNEFSRLKDMTKNNYYDLPERMNKLLNNPSKDFRENINYLLEPTLDNPNNYNDALYRLCLYYQLKRQSHYITYSLLNRINFLADIETQIPLLRLKSRILQDIVSAKRALGKLKPEKKEKHKVIIGKERIKFIVKSIVAFAKVERGYLEWGNFIDQSQSQESWLSYIFDELIFWLAEMEKHDTDLLINQSWANQDRYDGDSENKIFKTMKLLKALSNEEFRVDDINEIIKGILKFAEIEKSDQLKIWGRYYSAMLKIQQGLFQESNDLALTILEYYGKVSIECKDTCIQLGLVTWAISQYRLGREIEGMLCILASIYHIKHSKEILPLMEFGFQIICDFIQKNVELLSPDQKLKLKGHIAKYTEHNIEVSYTEFLLNSRLEHYVKTAHLTLNFVEKGSLEWRVAVIQIIDGLLILDKYDKAIEIISSNAKLIVESLADRLDIRPNKILSWLQNIQRGNQLKKADKETIYYLIDIALKDFENSRKVKHKDERAAIGEKINSLSRIFLELFAKMEDLENKVLQLKHYQIEMIAKYITYLTPRAIVEQKKYYKNSTINDELFDLENRYNLLRDNYQILYQKSNGKSEALKTLGLTIDKIQKVLNVEHPNYRSLVDFEAINFKTVQESLEKQEIIFQYILLDNFILQLLITDTDVSVLFKEINKTALMEHIKTLNYQVNYNGNVSKSILETITSQVASMLFQHLNEIEYRSLFMIPQEYLQLETGFLETNRTKTLGLLRSI